MPHHIVSSPVWKGPLVDGVTQSLLSRYVVCKHRFKLLAIDGLKEQQEFSHRLEYGSMWHVCEDALGQGKAWDKPLRQYCQELCLKYSTARREIDKWYKICKVEFPLYVDYWKNHSDVKNRQAISHEEVFDIPCKLPSGRVVRLRGKFDGVDKIGKEICLQENKVKGDIDEDKIMSELPSNLQTMMYVAALNIRGQMPSAVRYNVIRRPLSDWQHKFSIRQRKGRKTKAGLVGVETDEEFHIRLGKLIEDNASSFFMRWRVPITTIDLTRFCFECLYPLLENLCDDFEWWVACFNPENELDIFDYKARELLCPQHKRRHWRLPFGVYNAQLEGRKGAYYDYINTGNKRGLEQVESLFGELQ